MNKKLICAATLGAFAPAHVMAQALEQGQRPLATVYWEVPLGAVSAKDAMSAFGLRLHGTQSPAGNLFTPPPPAAQPPRPSLT